MDYEYDKKFIVFSGLHVNANRKTKRIGVEDAPFLESIRRTVLVGSVWVKKYTKINIEKMKSGKS